MSLEDCRAKTCDVPSEDFSALKVLQNAQHPSTYSLSVGKRGHAPNVVLLQWAKAS